MIHSQEIVLRVAATITEPVKHGQQRTLLRRQIAAKYGLSFAQSRKLTPFKIAQLENCSDPEACKLILGVSH